MNNWLIVMRWMDGQLLFVSGWISLFIQLPGRPFTFAAMAEYENQWVPAGPEDYGLSDTLNTLAFGPGGAGYGYIAGQQSAMPGGMPPLVYQQQQQQQQQYMMPGAMMPGTNGFYPHQFNPPPPTQYYTSQTSTTTLQRSGNQYRVRR